MGENGFLPLKLIGLRAQWDDSNAYVTDSYGQDWVRLRGANLLCGGCMHVLAVSLHTTPHRGTLNASGWSTPATLPGLRASWWPSGQTS